jgi:outer membrane PBP1 activator LpoA protein
MGCPIHIWLPLMGAAAPIARAARDRFRFARDARRAEAAPPRETRRWAPVADSATRPSETSEVAR